jgi:hypothetical protein
MPPLTIHLSRYNNNNNIYIYNCWFCSQRRSVIIITSVVCIINSKDIILIRIQN